MSKFKEKFSILLLLLYTSHANSDTSHFTGITIEAASGYQNMRITAKDLSASVGNITTALPNNIPPKNISGVPYAFNYGYIAGLTNRTTLGARLEYNPRTSRYAAVILPGYVISENTQGYLRMGYAYMASTIDVKLPGVQSQIQKAYFYGPTIGIGIKYNAFNNFYIYYELNYYQYRDVGLAATTPGQFGQTIRLTGTASSRVSNMLIGIGYRF